MRFLHYIIFMVYEKLYWVIFYRHDTFEIGKVVVTDVNPVSNDSVKILNQSFAKTTFRDGFFYLKNFGWVCEFDIPYVYVIEFDLIWPL